MSDEHWLTLLLRFPVTYEAARRMAITVAMTQSKLPVDKVTKFDKEYFEIDHGQVNWMRYPKCPIFPSWDSKDNRERF